MATDDKRVTVDPYNLMSARERMALEEAKRLYEIGESSCWARRDRMLDWGLAWHNVVTLQHPSQRSQVPHDVTREAVERILPKLLGTSMGFSYFKQGQYAEIPSKLSKHYLHKMRYRRTMLRTNRDKLIYGRGIRKWSWHVDKRERQRTLTDREIQAMLAMGMDATQIPRKTADTVTLYDGPRCHAVDPFCMTYDTAVDDPHTQSYTFEECRETPQSIRAKSDRGLYREAAAKALLAQEKSSRASVQRWRDEAIARKGIDIGTTVTTNDPSAYYLLEGYFWFDLDGDGRDEHVLLVTDPEFKYPLRLEANPYDHAEAPYVYDDWMGLTGEFWPVGVVEVLEPIQGMANIWGNLGLDNISLAVFNVWLKHRDAQIPGNVLKAIPNQMIATSMTDGLQPLTTQDHTANILTHVTYWQKRAQEQSGITQFNALGTPELGQTKTALGIQTLKAAAEEFLAFAKETMKDESMSKDAEFFLSLLQQFMDRPLDLALRCEDSRAEPFHAEPDDLAVDFEWDVSIEQNTPLSRELESRSFEEWVADSLKIGTPLNVPLISLELGKRKGISRPERFMLQPQGAPGMGPGPGQGPPGAPGAAGPPSPMNLPPDALAQMAAYAAEGAGTPLPGGASTAGGAQPAAGG